MRWDLVSPRAVIRGMSTVPCGDAKQPLSALPEKETHHPVDKSMLYFVAEMDTKELPITHQAKYLKSEATARSLR